MHVIEAFDLYRFYHTNIEETLALRGVSLHVDAGEIVAVMGPSGSGKSTLLSCLSGIDEPDGGYVKLSGRRLTRQTEAMRAAMRAGEIGIVLQSKSLIDHLSIENNIKAKMWLAHKNDKSLAANLLELVGLTRRARAYPPNVSGGEAARAAIAVAMSTSPKLLIADEPTGEVDAETEKLIIGIFENYRKSGGAAIIATHSTSLALHADRMIRLFDGRVVDDA